MTWYDIAPHPPLLRPPQEVAWFDGKENSRKEVGNPKENDLENDLENIRQNITKI